MLHLPKCPDPVEARRAEAKALNRLDLDSIACQIELVPISGAARHTSDAGLQGGELRRRFLVVLDDALLWHLYKKCLCLCVYGCVCVNGLLTC